MREKLDEATWRARRTAHRSRVDAWVAPYLERRGRAASHPVDDFLFTYYSYSPAALRRWHPGIGVDLLGPGVSAFGDSKGYLVSPGRAHLDPRFVVERLERAVTIRRLLESTASRPALTGCFGLHEWAMVYQEPTGAVRHSSYPLRLGSRATDKVVESHRISCTHFDAFRFFSAAARPLNAVRPTRGSREVAEQPGCLHATMDLYRWAYTLAPLTGSELVADCFDLAYAARQVDMRASPYDFEDLGLVPIPIETAAGKAEYIAAQHQFSERGAELRSRLLDLWSAGEMYGRRTSAVTGRQRARRSP